MDIIDRFDSLNSGSGSALENRYRLGADAQGRRGREEEGGREE